LDYFLETSDFFFMMYIELLRRWVYVVLLYESVVTLL